jgi:hypothetical protein
LQHKSEKGSKEMTIDLKQQAKEATSIKLETSREYAAKLLSSGTFAMQEKRTNNELYQAARRDQIKLGLRAPNAHEVGQGIRQQWDRDKASEGTLTSAQIAAVTEFSKEQVRSLTGTQITELKVNDPAKYQRYRLAAATHGILPTSVLDKLNVADVLAPDETLQPIPAVVAEALNLDPTLKVSSAGMDRALREYAQITAKRIIEQQQSQGAD